MADPGGRIYFGEVGDGAGASGGVGGREAIEVGIRAGNINISKQSAERLELTDTMSKTAIEAHKQTMMELDASKRARVLAVPTIEADVVAKLRELGHPKTLFGENPADRRERLRDIMAYGDASRAVAAREVKQAKEAAAAAKPSEPELFYTEGTPELVAAREAIAAFSFPKALARVKAQRAETPETRDEASRKARELYDTLKIVRATASQVGDSERPMSSVHYSPDGKYIATGSWGGRIKLWDHEDMVEAAKFKGHPERVTCIGFHPGFATQSNDSLHFASASADATVRLWSLGSSEPVGTLRGHVSRLSRCQFHPSGNYLATTSYDRSWRLWDVETQKEVLLQEGHAREVYPLVFHPDGSLVATGDLGGLGRLWDLRSGRCVMVLQGHIKQLLALDFSPNGYTLATGSDDHTSHIWDIRAKKRVYTLLAHSALISHVKFAPKSGEYLATASFDGHFKTWCARDWSPIADNIAHESKIMFADIHPGEKQYVTCSFDRTFKTWGL